MAPISESTGNATTTRVVGCLAIYKKSDGTSPCMWAKTFIVFIYTAMKSKMAGKNSGKFFIHGTKTVNMKKI